MTSSSPLTPMTLHPIILEGRIVRLEPLSLDHYERLAAIALDPDLWQWTVTRLDTPDDVRSYIETAMRQQAAGLAIPFATIDKAAGLAVGSTRFHPIDLPNRKVEIGWTWIAKPWQRTAVNTEAKYLMMRYAFETLNCLRVELKTDVFNERSRRAIARLGAVEEGTLRNHMILPSGRVRDSVYFSVIASEWPTVKANLERMLNRPYPASE
jgi:RimJ/RimL family protein N-acetyltransferase